MNGRLSRILIDQLGTVELNKPRWKHRIPHALLRKVYDAKEGCGICGKIDQGKALAMDHCHDTGVVRGFLCMNCNTALGHFQDDPALLRKAVAYLEAHVPGVEY